MMNDNITFNYPTVNLDTVDGYTIKDLKFLSNYLDHLLPRLEELYVKLTPDLVNKDANN